MPTLELTKEEMEAAMLRAQKEKEERIKGTSVEHSKQIMQLSPEMQAALSSVCTEAVTAMFKQETEMRQKLFDESANQARSFVGNAVEMGYMKKQRERKENEIIAGFIQGIASRKPEMVDKAWEQEKDLLGGRDTRAELKVRSMGAATAGDELIPEIWTNQLIENIEVLGVSRRLCQVIPMTSDTMKFPKVSTNVIAYEVAAGAQITASDLVTATVTLSQRKLATITAMQNELLVNANPAIIPLLTRLAALAIALKEDTLAFTGASSSVSGILESGTNNVVNGGSTTSGNTTIADIDFDDFARLVDALSSQYIDNGCQFVFNKKVSLYLSTLASAANYLWAPATAAAPGMIRGFSYTTSSVMPSAPAVTTAYAFFGNLKNMYFGDRGVYTVKVSDAATVGSDNMFEKDMSALRVTELVDMVIADANGFSVLKTATT